MIDMEQYIWIFLVLMFINWICDYPLQNFFLAEWKQKDNLALIIHCFIWAMGVSITLYYFGIFAWWKLIQLFVGHLLIDYWKCRGIYKKHMGLTRHHCESVNRSCWWARNHGCRMCEKSTLEKDMEVIQKKLDHVLAMKEKGEDIDYSKYLEPHHYLSDIDKVKKLMDKRDRKAYYIDHILHVIQIGVCLI